MTVGIPIRGLIVVKPRFHIWAFQRFQLKSRGSLPVHYVNMVILVVPVEIEGFPPSSCQSITFNVKFGSQFTWLRLNSPRFPLFVRLGRRKRRKIVRKVRRSLPKFFKCPRCGTDSVRVIKREEGGERRYVVVCGSCGLRAEYSGDILLGREPIDLYNMFVDAFYKGELS